MTIDQIDALIEKFFEEKLRTRPKKENRERSCLSCYFKNSNWIIYLQDCLEDAGIDSEKFCAKIPGLMTVERGRLRLNDGHQCFSMETARKVLESL